jgi:hypothetical protein
MKNIFLFAPLLFLLFSCKKTPQSQPYVTLPSLAYISNDQIGSHVVDSFVYNTDHDNLGEFWVVNYDTSIVVYQNDFSFIFYFSANNHLPDSCLYNGTDIHQLTYDNQNRIIKDTGSGVVTYFTYPSNAIVCTEYSGGSVPAIIDTLGLSNGNVVSEYYYVANISGTSDSSVSMEHYTYSSYANPLYSSAIANTIGPLVYFLDQDHNADPISQKMFSTSNEINNIGIVTDSHGRIAQALVSYIASPGTPHPYTYTYYP